MKDNLKPNLKMLASFIVITSCFIAIMWDIRYKNINIKSIALFVIIIASIYFGIAFNNKKKLKKVGDTINNEVIPLDESIPTEFQDGENKFSELNEKGMLN